MIPTEEELRPEADRIGAALGAIATGATLGAAVIVVGLAALRGHLAGPLPLVLFSGLVAAALSAWLTAGVIDDTWRRAVAATLAAVGALILAGLAAPADLAGGRAGLVAYAALLAAGSWFSLRVTRRASAG